MSAIPGLSIAHPSDVLDMPVDPNEPTYCLCHQVSYGEMIACDKMDVSCLLLYIITFNLKFHKLYIICLKNMQQTILPLTSSHGLVPSNFSSQTLILNYNLQFSKMHEIVRDFSQSDSQNEKL